MKIRFFLSLATCLALPLNTIAQPAGSPSMPTGGLKPASSAASGSSASDLAAKLTNPVADLISVPLQFNSYQGLGADGKGKGYDLVFQPVVPLKLNQDWNYIVRPVATLGILDNVDGYSGTGVGPVVIETFLSPNNNDKFIWGIGPVVSTPSLSGDNFGTRQTGLGVTGVGLYMSKPWTVGLLAYNTWDVGGSSVAGTANNTYWQPFVSYVTENAWTFSLNTQSSFNWDARRAQNPLNFTVSKLSKIGDMPVSYSLGTRYFATSVPDGPTGWGVRAGITFLFPD
ncbi:MAG: transporter [Burkholderiaceae bacterium]|nr:transporter [Burkholderiaceae bacterium]MCD8537181.1 transporter [Burkholderiaceae bacterium]MCD8565085.1 transporter [Burkholderiaceae bacterium]